MLPTPWNLFQIKQYRQQSRQALLTNEQSLGCYQQDFGHLISSKPNAITIPSTIDALQHLLNYANTYALPVTIRGNGMSQSGQSLATAGGLVIHMQHFNTVDKPVNQTVWIAANARWADCLSVSLTQSLVPFVIPYNCQLSIAGVLSAGGIGASSFKYGSAINHIKALDIITADGQCQQVDANSSLFHACLGGQGQFGIITRVCLALRPCKSQVRTFFLVYLDQISWLKDLQEAKQHTDYIESFCTPSIQGARLVADKRLPFAQWLFALHIAIEYDNDPPTLADVSARLNPWKQLHQQDESIHAYLHRHDERFNAMKLAGQWQLAHPWYECFVPARLLLTQLDDILSTLPLHYATLLHIAPVASNAASSFLMLPQTTDDIFSVMILNPGVIDALLPSCLDTIRSLDERFLNHGGKRYLSGFLGSELATNYWVRHFGDYHRRWVTLKQQYDPNHIFSSALFNPF